MAITECSMLAILNTLCVPDMVQAVALIHPHKSVPHMHWHVMQVSFIATCMFHVSWMDLGNFPCMQQSSVRLLSQSAQALSTHSRGNVSVTCNVKIFKTDTHMQHIWYNAVFLTHQASLMCNLHLTCLSFPVARIVHVTHFNMHFASTATCTLFQLHMNVTLVLHARSGKHAH